MRNSIRSGWNSFNRSEKQMFFAVVLYFVVFLVFRILSGNYYLADSYEYLEFADRIRELEFFSNEGLAKYYTKRPFVYPLFLAIINNFPIWVTLIIQSIVSVTTFLFLFIIIKRNNVSLRFHYLLIVFLTPSVFIYTHLIMADWLVLFFITILFYLLTIRWSKKSFATIQLVTVLLPFIKPVFYPLVYINFVFWSFYFLKKKVFSFWLFVPILVVQLYISYNSYQSGYRHFSSIENTNLIDYNLYLFKSNSFSQELADNWKDSIYNSSFSDKSFAEQNKTLRNVAKDELMLNLFSYSKYHFFTAIRGVFDPGRFDIMTFFRNEDGSIGFLTILNSDKSIIELFNDDIAYVYLILIPVFVMVLIKWFFTIRYLIFSRVSIELYYLLIVMGCYILITGPVNSSRYMVPFQGVLFVMTVIGINLKRKNQK